MESSLEDTLQKEVTGGCEAGSTKQCTFCTIAHGEDPSTELLYQDDSFVAFRNITPAAAHHYLIIPKEHIQDGRSLAPTHEYLVNKMADIGKNLLHNRGYNDSDSRCGFHWPPFTSVPHLHLHVIAPEKELSFKARLSFLPGSRWFLTPNEVVEKLKKKKIYRSSL